MILALLLQAAVFESYVDEARVKLGLDKPIAIEVYTEPIDVGDGPVVAWVPRGRNQVRVWDTALAQASKDAQKVIAYHEACTVYLDELSKTAYTPFQKHLVHALMRQCTVETLGEEFQRILRKLSNGSYGSRLGTVLWWRKRCPKSP